MDDTHIVPLALIAFAGAEAQPAAVSLADGWSAKG